jgi:hypothetical protein
MIQMKKHISLLEERIKELELESENGIKGSSYSLDNGAK